VFNVTFNNISVISWQSVLLVGEPGGPGENHRPVASRRQTLSHKGPIIDKAESVNQISLKIFYRQT
jgi:hypothetical protein